MTIWDKWIESFTIFKKYCPEVSSCLQAAHDQVYAIVDVDDIPVDSEDGKRLLELGWFVDENDGWSHWASA